MLRMIKNKNGQGASVEYAVVFFLVVAGVVGMSTYVKRGVQARIHGARNYAWTQVNSVYSETHPNAVLPVEYEPYYSRTTTDRDEYSVTNEEYTSWPGHEGKYQTGISSVITTSGTSITAPPGQAE
ncbi:MAG: hypothetical protein H6754_02990 [Candidatus Omnitrophica bacterium]|nr:hypothetical protein [Candidatus Omnitrophota bacterium]